jgi:hypothetical protein
MTSQKLANGGVAASVLRLRRTHVRLIVQQLCAEHLAFFAKPVHLILFAKVSKFDWQGCS